MSNAQFVVIAGLMFAILLFNALIVGTLLVTILTRIDRVLERMVNRGE